MDRIYDIEEYLKRPYWVIDILPHQVPDGSKGQFFKIEQFYLSPPRIELLCAKFVHILLKLNCYDDIAVSGYDGVWTENPAPEELARWVMDRKAIHVLLKSADAMITAGGDDLYMTVYGPDEATLRLVSTLAAAQGLFVWNPCNQASGVNHITTA